MLLSLYEKCRRQLGSGRNWYIPHFLSVRLAGMEMGTDWWLLKRKWGRSLCQSEIQSIIMSRRWILFHREEQQDPFPNIIKIWFIAGSTAHGVVWTLRPGFSLPESFLLLPAFPWLFHRDFWGAWASLNEWLWASSWLRLSSVFTLDFRFTVKVSKFLCSSHRVNRLTFA